MFGVFFSFPELLAKWNYFCVSPLQQSFTARCIMPRVSPTITWEGSEEEW